MYSIVSQSFTQRCLKTSSQILCIAVIWRFSLRYSILLYASITIYLFVSLLMNIGMISSVTNNVAINSLAKTSRSIDLKFKLKTTFGVFLLWENQFPGWNKYFT